MRLKMSMPTISSPLASFLYDLANVVLSVGALAVLVGTIGAIWMGSVKERYSDERIAANEAQTATANAAAERAKEGASKADERASEANKEAARANERAGNLEKEAAEARVEQERLRVRSLELQLQINRMGPRQLSQSQINSIMSSVKSETFRPMLRVDYSDDAETIPYAEALANAFLGSGMNVRQGSRLISGGGFGLTVMDRSGVTQRALRAAGLKFSEQNLDQDQSITVLNVGRKPPQ